MYTAGRCGSTPIGDFGIGGAGGAGGAGGPFVSG